MKCQDEMPAIEDKLFNITRPRADKRTTFSFDRRFASMIYSGVSEGALLGADVEIYAP